MLLAVAIFADAEPIVWMVSLCNYLRHLTLFLLRRLCIASICIGELDCMPADQPFQAPAQQAMVTVTSLPFGSWHSANALLRGQFMILAADLQAYTATAAWSRAICIPCKFLLQVLPIHTRRIKQAFQPYFRVRLTTLDMHMTRLKHI